MKVTSNIYYSLELAHGYAAAVAYMAFASDVSIRSSLFCPLNNNESGGVQILHWECLMSPIPLLTDKLNFQLLLTSLF